MPIDTSIALGVKPVQLQTIDPMSVYQAMQDQQYNALRAQALQRNTLAMQYAAEDRRAAAAKAAQERAQAAEFSRILQGGYKPAKNAIMGPGTIQGSTPASFDEGTVLNALYAKGNPAMLTAYSNMQEQIAKQREAEAKATGQGLANVKTQTETAGVLTENQKKRIELADAQIKNLSTIIGGALTPEAVYAAYKAAPDALALRGQTPDSAIQIFNQKVAEVGFDRARMEVERNVFDTAKQLSDEIKILESPQGQFAYTPRTNQTQRITAPTGEPVMPMDKRSVTNIDMKGQSKFAEELGTLQARKLVEGQQSAEKAANLIDTVNQGRKLLDKGVITGYGADFRLAFAKGAKELGVKGFDGKIQNTEAYMSNMAKNTALLIDSFGAGSAISDADREYAAKMAAGEISLDEQSLRKILGIAEEVARNTIEKHNARAGGVKSELPLTIEQPSTASGLPYFTHPSQVKAANLPSGTRFMTPDGEKVVP